MGDLFDRLGRWIRVFLSGTEDGTSSGVRHVVKTDPDGRLEIVGHFGYTFGDPLWYVDGWLAPATNVGPTFVCPRSGYIAAVYLYVEELGTASSTIVDVNVNGTTIFAPAERPEVLWNASQNWVRAVPSSGSVDEGDLITLDIDQVADNSYSATILVAMTGPSGETPTVVILNDLGDVAAFPTDGQALVYDDGSGLWIASFATPGSHTHVEADITDLDHDAVKIQGRDVDPSAPSEGYLLTWDVADGWKPKVPRPIAAQIVFTVDGANLDTTGDRPFRIYAYLPPGVIGTVTSVTAYVDTSPTTDDLQIQVKKNGTGIITGGYVEIPIGAHSAITTNFDDAVMETDDFYTFEVVQGDPDAANLSLHIRYTY